MTKKFRIWGLVQDRLSPVFVLHNHAIEMRLILRKLTESLYLGSRHKIISSAFKRASRGPCPLKAGPPKVLNTLETI